MIISNKTKKLPKERPIDFSVNVRAGNFGFGNLILIKVNAFAMLAHSHSFKPEKVSSNN